MTANVRSPACGFRKSIVQIFIFQSSTTLPVKRIIEWQILDAQNLSNCKLRIGKNDLIWQSLSLSLSLSLSSDTSHALYLVNSIEANDFEPVILRSVRRSMQRMHTHCVLMPLSRKAVESSSFY